MHLVGTHRLMDVWVPRVTTLIFTYSGGGHCSPSSHLPNHPLCVEQSPVKTEEKDLLNTSAAFLSVVSSLPVLLSGGYALLDFPFLVDVPIGAFLVSSVALLSPVPVGHS